MAKELKALQQENARLKKLLAEQSLDKLVSPERRWRRVAEVRRRLKPEQLSERKK